jgi:trehalose utilization protein
MQSRTNRRDFVAISLATAATSPGPVAGRESRPIRVVVWDERQTQQKQAYDNFLGNEIAKHLKTKPGIEVTSVSLEDDERGISPAYLRTCDVLIWWGHVRQAEITPQMAKPILQRIKEGSLALIALHSAHWATPFVEAMYDRTRSDAEKAFQKAGKPVEITYVDPPRRYTTPKFEDRPTPYTEVRKFPDGSLKAKVHLPWCCFPAYRNDGKTSQMRVLRADHPITQGLPGQFELPQTEMYCEAFHVPEPDEVILEERWATGEWFRSGCLWNIGKGKVLYLRPGHETFPIFKDKHMLQILENAVRHLAPVGD